MAQVRARHICKHSCADSDAGPLPGELQGHLGLTGASFTTRRQNIMGYDVMNDNTPGRWHGSRAVATTLSEHRPM